jgi:hypothetical protein
MQPNLMMLHLHNRDTITYPTNQCSIQLIVHILEAKGHSVVIPLYPHNTIKNLTNNEKQFAVLVGDALLIINYLPPPRWLSQWRRRVTAAPLAPGLRRETQMAQRPKIRMKTPATYCPPPTIPRWTRISLPNQRRGRMAAAPLVPGPRRETQTSQRQKIRTTTPAIYRPPPTTPRWNWISPPVGTNRSSRRFPPHSVRGLGSGQHNNATSHQLINTVALKDAWVRRGAGKNVW